LYRALRLFRITIALGFVLNMTFAVPALFTPRLLEGLLVVGTTNTPWWLQNVGLLLVIISSMYIPVVIDPFRYIFITFLAVAGRFSAGLLFLLGMLGVNFPDGFRTLAAVDLILSSVQALLLYFMLQDGDPQRPPGAVA
jgi:hypothetical protein